jgi:hypothetical protein
MWDSSALRQCRNDMWQNTGKNKYLVGLESYLLHSTRSLVDTVILCLSVDSSTFFWFCRGTSREEEEIVYRTNLIKHDDNRKVVLCVSKNTYIFVVTGLEKHWRGLTQQPH